MCDLYLSRRSSNLEISEFWSFKIRPEQYVLFNLASLMCVETVQYEKIFQNYFHERCFSSKSLSDHMCDLYLSRRSSNLEISEFWSFKIRPEQYVLFNLASLMCVET